MKLKLLSHVWLFATPWTVAYQGPLSMGFSRQEYWSGLPFPSPGDLPSPGIEPRSPALQADTLLANAPNTYHVKTMNLIWFELVPFTGYLSKYLTSLGSVREKTKKWQTKVKPWLFRIIVWFWCLAFSSHVLM